MACKRLKASPSLTSIQAPEQDDSAMTEAPIWSLTHILVPTVCISWKKGEPALHWK